MYGMNLKSFRLGKFNELLQNELIFNHLSHPGRLWFQHLHSDILNVFKW